MQTATFCIVGPVKLVHSVFFLHLALPRTSLWQCWVLIWTLLRTFLHTAFLKVDGTCRLPI